MASIQDVPNEILKLIFQHFTRPTQFATLCLVCKRFKDMAGPTRFRKLALPIDGTKNMLKKFQRLVQNDDPILRCVREIDVVTPRGLSWDTGRHLKTWGRELYAIVQFIADSFPEDTLRQVYCYVEHARVPFYHQFEIAERQRFMEAFSYRATDYLNHFGKPEKTLELTRETVGKRLCGATRLSINLNANEDMEPIQLICTEAKKVESLILGIHDQDCGYEPIDPGKVKLYSGFYSNCLRAMAPVQFTTLRSLNLRHMNLRYLEYEGDLRMALRSLETLEIDKCGGACYLLDALARDFQDHKPRLKKLFFSQYDFRREELESLEYLHRFLLSFKGLEELLLWFYPWSVHPTLELQVVGWCEEFDEPIQEYDETFVASAVTPEHIAHHSDSLRTLAINLNHSRKRGSDIFWTGHPFCLGSEDECSRFFDQMRLLESLLLPYASFPQCIEPTRREGLYKTVKKHIQGPIASLKNLRCLALTDTSGSDLERLGNQVSQIFQDFQQAGQNTLLKSITTSDYAGFQGRIHEENSFVRSDVDSPGQLIKGFKAVLIDEDLMKFSVPHYEVLYNFLQRVTECRDY